MNNNLDFEEFTVVRHAIDIYLTQTRKEIVEVKHVGKELKLLDTLETRYRDLISDNNKLQRKIMEET